MVRRRAIAAVASAVLFSSLLATALLVLESAQQEGQLLDQVNIEDSLNVRSATLSATAGLSLLDEAQILISSQTFECIGPEDMPLTLGISLVDLGSPELSIVANISKVANISMGPSATISDNLTLLGDFSGARQGAFNFRLATSLTSVQTGGVSLSEKEVHLVNVPGDLYLVRSFCSRSMSILEDLLATASSCNATLVYSAMDEAAGYLAVLAAEHGLSFQLSHDVQQGTICQVSYVIRVSEEGIMGPLGRFTLTAEQESRDLLPTSVGTGQARISPETVP